MKKESKQKGISDFWIIFFSALLILNFFQYYIRPITDSDIWFHLLYGKIFLKNLSMVIDHTMFSWSPTTNEAIYHSWLGSIIYYLSYLMGGINSFLVIRFIMIISFNVLALYYLYKLDLIRNYLAWFLLISCQVFLIHVGQDKPAVISFFLLTFVVFYYWYLVNKKSFNFKYFYLFPIIMLIWVNTHGGFIFGVAFFIMILLGEIFNSLFSKKNTFDKSIIKHFYVSIFLSFVVCLFTPYGYKYLIYLFNTFVLGYGDPLILLSINEYSETLPTKPILDHIIYYTIFFFLFGLIFFSLLNRNIHFSIIFTNLVFIYLFMKYLRATFFLAPVLFFSTIYLLKNSAINNFFHKRYIFNIFLILSVIFCTHNTIFYFYRTFCVLSFQGLSLDKGIGYFEREAGIILNNLKNYRLCNDYISGAYILWKGWPEIKVMMDARQFPYKDWYREYLLDFFGANNLKDFLEKYRCEVVLASYNSRVIAPLIMDPQWNIVHIGHRGVLFKKNTIPLPLDAYGVQQTDFNFSNIQLSNGYFNIILEILDFEAIEKYLKYFENRIICDRQKNELKSRRNLYLALKAYLSDDYINADKYMREIGVRHVANINMYKELCLRLAQYHINKNDFHNAYYFVQNAFIASKEKGDDLLFSIGVIKWLSDKNNIRLENDIFNDISWQTFLHNFLKNKIFATDEKTIIAYQIMSNNTPEKITIY